MFGVEEMKTVFTLIIAFATVATALGAEADLQKLEPEEPKDRAALFSIVKRSSNGKSNRAAKILAEAGLMEELLKILRTTTSYNTMQAIAQTRDERTIPVFESRLRNDPHNRYLVGSLAYVQNPKASPILVALLKQHADAKRPSDQDMVGCLLNAILLNRCQDAIPILRERFEGCGIASQADRKSNFALTLLSLGDPIGTSWLSKRLHEDIESRVVHSWTVDRLATICDWMPPRHDIVTIQDEAIMMPLLHELVRGASSAECPFARECCRVLRVLTRHDFPVGDAAWRKWYSDHADKHPIYTTPLNRAVKLCIYTFRNGLAGAADKSERLKWMDYFLGQPRNGFGSHNNFLWELESHPELHATALLQERPPPLEERKELGLSFTIAMTSRLREPAHQIFRQDFSSINITASLASPVRDEITKNELITLAKQACGILSEYETFCQKAKDAKPGAPPDKQ